MMRVALVLMGSFFKIGLFTVGGGLAVIPLIQQEMLSRGWLTNQEFLDVLGMAQSTPGPMGVNTATFVGYRVAVANGGNVWWALVISLLATIAVMAPNVIGVSLGGSWFERNKERPVVAKVLSVLRPLVAGFVTAFGVNTALEIFGCSVRDVSSFVFNWVYAVLFLVAFGVTVTKRVSPLWALLFALAVGVVDVVLKGSPI